MAGCSGIASSGGIYTKTGESAGEEHGNSLADGAPVECPAAANAIEGEHANESGELDWTSVSHWIHRASQENTYHVEDIVQSRDPLNILRGDTSNSEDCGGVDSDPSNTNPLLHNLEPDDELHTSSSVEFAGSNTEKHGVVGV